MLKITTFFPSGSLSGLAGPKVSRTSPKWLHRAALTTEHHRDSGLHARGCAFSKSLILSIPLIVIRPPSIFCIRSGHGERLLPVYTIGQQKQTEFDQIFLVYFSAVWDVQRQQGFPTLKLTGCEINNVVSPFAEMRLTSKGPDQNRSKRHQKAPKSIKIVQNASKTRAFRVTHLNILRGHPLWRYRQGRFCPSEGAKRALLGVQNT